MLLGIILLGNKKLTILRKLIMKKMLLIGLSASAFLTSTVFAEQLTSFDSILNSLKNGKQLTVSVGIGSCTTDGSIPLPYNSGDNYHGFKIDSWTYSNLGSTRTLAINKNHPQTSVLKDDAGNDVFVNIVKVGAFEQEGNGELKALNFVSNAKFFDSNGSKKGYLNIKCPMNAVTVQTL